MCQKSEHRDTVGMDPNGADADDVWRIPVEIAEVRSSFVVVRLRAGSLSEARARAMKDVEQLCQTGELDDVLGYNFDWLHDEYECRGIAQVKGHIADYNVDIDKVDEPTDHERQLQKAQLPLKMPHWICPSCGLGVKADEDGCCCSCGAACEVGPE